MLRGCKWRRWARNKRRSGCHLVARPINDFVELAPVEPHTTAVRAVVDLHAVAVGHDEVDPSINGTLLGRERKI